MQHILEYVDKHGADADDPSMELYDIYQEFMRSAMGSYRAALESNAEASFPVFAEQTASWHGGVAELHKSAQRRTADAKRRGSISTVDTVPTPSSARRVDFGRFANVRVDGAPAGRSRDSDGASSTQSFGGGGGAVDAGTPATARHASSHTSPIGLGASPTPAGRISSCGATTVFSLFRLTTLFATSRNARTPETSLISTVTIASVQQAALVLQRCRFRATALADDSAFRGSRKSTCPTCAARHDGHRVHGERCRLAHSRHR